MMLELGSETVLEQIAAATAIDEPRRESECLSTAEVADCTCPDFCERDHDVD
jgi:hypothetical protein